MDFIVGLLPSRHKSNVYDSILVMMNQYIKMVWYLPTNAIIKSHELGDLLMEEVFLHGSGTPMGIVSDRGPVFTSDYWSELCYYMKILKTHQRCKMLMTSNISTLKEQEVRKDENTLFLSFSQKVFLGFYWGFTEKMKQDKNFSLMLLKSQETLLQSTLNTYTKQKLHTG